MDYNFTEIEKKWQQYWLDHKTFKADIDKNKPKYYVLDMFPYPSGSGLHVGHPLGYIASDIYTRFMRLKGFNVLHPMGYDAYGLPAEQYAIQTGTHPSVTTAINIARYREQMDKIGFSFDWDREVRTSDPAYYKWTQWTFIRLFHSWYNRAENKAEKIEDLVIIFEKDGNSNVKAASNNDTAIFSASGWKSFSEKKQQEILMNYRLAYLADTMVNWCPALGTVLANDEVSEGFSIRGGHPVERKKMKQWLLRITAYADRLLQGLETIDWPESIKEIQKNWIGKSVGCEAMFEIKGYNEPLEIFTTRADTLFGVTFMVLAPEHPFVSHITTIAQKEKIAKYVLWAKNRSERERMTEVKKVSGEFTGAYAINPLNGAETPIYVADYVLMGYGTGAIMAVPGHDSRDFAFARHFNLPIVQVVCRKGDEPTDPDTWEESYDSKEGMMINSGFITGMDVKTAIKATIQKVEEMHIGYGTINYRLRDAIFSRQRYWGEPFPIYYKDGMPYTIPESSLPIELPPIDAYLPTESGDPPLARAINWATPEGYPLEVNTMPGFAGSSGYYLRYMDPRNSESYFSRESAEYWQNVDLYIGGAEHATGHLIYSRFWNKFLFDIDCAVCEEPFKKLINQGMIQGRSSFVYRVKQEKVAEFLPQSVENDNYKQIPVFVSKNFPDRERFSDPLHVDISIVHNDILDTEAFINWQPHLSESVFILEEGKYICGHEVEKMSKSKYNVQNPDDLIERYGADTLRMYEMFLGPIEQSKPWDTSGIEGVSRFIRKLWRLFHDKNNDFIVSDEAPGAAELKVIHKTIRKLQDDTERFSFNTAVSSFMICVNELMELHCNKREILEKLVVILSPYAPHIAEELWSLLGYNSSVGQAAFPEFDESYLTEDTFTYPVSFNGKTRLMLVLPVDMPPSEVEQAVLAAPEAQKWLQGATPKKVIVVPRKIVNVVL
ncbi:MAG: leucine--tRNA ligase [Bacteroidota bacterium]